MSRSRLWLALSASVALVVPLAVAAPAQAATATTSASTTIAAPSTAAAKPPAAGTVVATGPGWVLVGEGGRVAPSASTQRLATDFAVSPMSVTNCGYSSCSLYFSRSQTQWLHTNIAAAGGIYGGGGIIICAALAAASTVGAAFVAAGCTAVLAVYGGFIQNALNRAAGDNGCFRMRYFGAYGLAEFYDDHSGYCHNT